MNKKQNVQLSSDCKKTASNTLEAVSKKLETITLDTPNAASSSSQLQPQGSSNKAPQILKISETSSVSKLVSNNNHRTPIGPRYTISEIPDDPAQSEKKISIRKSTNNFNYSLRQDLKALDSKLTNVDNNNKEEKAKNDEKDSAKGSPRKSGVASSRTSEASTQAHPVRISKPDPITVCTCESLREQTAAAAQVIPKRVEPQSVPIYRWVSVKSQAAKTEQEKAAEIRLLLGKTGTSSPSLAKVTTNTYRSTKPRLCPFCWNEKQKARRQDKLKRERESKRVTNKKSNRQFNNIYGEFLDEVSDNRYIRR